MSRAMATEQQKIPSLILGTFQHRDPSLLEKVVEACFAQGILAFDTAPSYGTEHLLGALLADRLAQTGKERREIFVSTKIDAWQMQESNGRVDGFVDLVLGKMGLDYLDQLLIHWPIPEFLEETWKSFVRIRDSGKVRMIGVSNVRKRHLLRIMSVGEAPAIVQNERHPLRTDSEVRCFCRDNGIAYQAYSPLGQMMPKIRESKYLQSLAAKYGRNIAQIVMRWHLDTGSLPVFMTTKPQRVPEVRQVLDFTLSSDDLAGIDAMNEDHKLFLESIGCPGF